MPKSFLPVAASRASDASPQAMTRPGEEAVAARDERRPGRARACEPGWPAMAFIEKRRRGDPRRKPGRQNG